MKITTNNVPRDIINAYELTPDERKQFDYVKWDAIDEGKDSASFFRYRDRLYDLGEFMRAPASLAPWDRYSGDSYFSGTVVRIVEDGEQVIVGSYYE